jgi:hypothetical protein
MQYCYPWKCNILLALLAQIYATVGGNTELVRCIYFINLSIQELQAFTSVEMT